MICRMIRQSRKMAKINQKVSKHVPHRTCVTCRGKKTKRELIRLVRAADDKVTVDISGKADGRGVYLCSTQQCWENGINGGRVEHSLKTKLAEDNRRQIIGSLEAFFKENGEGNISHGAGEKLSDSKELER